MSKPKRRLSKKFKFTLGLTTAVLFLLSAIIVALLPQKDVNAYADSGAKVYLKDADNNIPTIGSTDVIYTTGDGQFQFAYISKGSGQNKVAVICGFDYEQSLPGGFLEIPEKVDAYRKHTDTQGTEMGYVAVSMNNEPLYYPIYRTDTIYETVLDSNGNPVFETDDQGQLVEKKQAKEVEVIDSFLPCYYKNIDKWEKYANGEERASDDYYYHDPSKTTFTVADFIKTTDDAHKRLSGATVNYIANQNIVKTDTGWTLSPTDSLGIFSKAKNIVELKFSDQILGIGNYAFRGCSNLKKVKFGDGINTIGNYAFAECRNLIEVDMPYNAVVDIIGEHAFESCEGLKKFTLPTGVEKIGDSCFEN